MGLLPYLVTLLVGVVIGMIYGMWMADEWYAERNEENETHN